MSAFRLQIVSQERILFDGEATSIVVPGEAGYFGVLAHHAPLLAALGKGKLTVRTAGAVLDGQIGGGFIEVYQNRATLLADRVEGDFATAEG